MGGLIELASRRRMAGAALIAAFVALVVGAGLGAGFMRPAQSGLTDLMFPTEGGDPGTVVVGVDAASVRQLGEWPWPRELQAELVSTLHQAGAKAIVLDAIYDREREDDAALVAAIREAGIVVIGAILSPGLRPGRLPTVGDDTYIPISAIAEAAAAVGFVDFPTDSDGVVRTAPLVAADDRGHLLPSLSFAAFSLLAGQGPGAITVRPAGLQVADRLIPTDNRKLMRIDFSSRFASQKSAGHTSAVEVLSGLKTKKIEGKVVFVGVTEVLTKDLEDTPVDKAKGSPGVMIHAQAFQTMRARTFITPVGALEVLAWAFVLAFGAAAAGMGRRLWIGSAVALVCVGAYFVIAAVRFEASGSQMNLLWPPVAAALGTVSTIGLRFVAERARRREVERLYEHLLATSVPDIEELEKLAQFAELKDDDTGKHIYRVGGYSQLIALASGLSEERAQTICDASKLHDSGKMGVPDAVLRKPGKLTDEEFDVMRRHPRDGHQRLEDSQSELIRIAAVIAHNHHERWDGSGYPNRTRGEDIPLEARIVAIADVFDALTSKRPYKEPWEPQRALDEIVRCAGTHFDPSLVEHFRGIFEDVVRLRSELMDEPQAVPKDA